MRILGKLKSKRGETLIEMLVSILILGFSIALLAVMVLASNSINEVTRMEGGNYLDDLSSAEARTDDFGAGKITIKANGASGNEVGIDVEFYGNVDSESLSPMWTYTLK